MRPSLWLPIAAALLAGLAVDRPPVGDEESYLWIGHIIDPLAPYAWRRVWPPFDDDAFVYAHPPLFLLWIALVERLVSSIAATRVLAGLPWVLLLAWSTGRLLERPDGRVEPGAQLGAVAWLSSATVVLGLQHTLLIDLPAVALGTAAMVAWRDPRGSTLRCGLLLGFAAATKYPVVLLGLVVLLDGARRRTLPRALGVVGWALLVVGLGELVIFGLHGQLHLVEVLRRSQEIPHGPALERTLGVWLRSGLLPLPGSSWSPVVGLLAGIGGLLSAEQLVGLEGLDLASRASVVVFAAMGGLVVFGAVRAAMSRGEPGLLGSWALVVMLGVVLFHNYAAARYLLLAGPPLAALIARDAGRSTLVTVVLSATLALVVVREDDRFARASMEVGERVIVQMGSHQPVFAAEWTLRHVLEAAGWRRLGPERPALGQLVVVADQSSAGLVPDPGWEPILRVESEARDGWKVVDIDDHIGLYAETLGLVPFGRGRGPVEGVTVYEVRR